jgi:hypothetical protein
VKRDRPLTETEREGPNLFHSGRFHVRCEMLYVQKKAMSESAKE